MKPLLEIDQFCLFQAMAKLAVTGQDVYKLVDCSDAVPIPKPAVKKPATFPAGTGPKDVQQSCPKPFPALKTDRKCKALSIKPNSPSDDFCLLKLVPRPRFLSALTAAPTLLSAPLRRVDKDQRLAVLLNDPHGPL